MSVVAEQIRDAHAALRTLRVRGAGTWLHAGRPVEAAGTVSVADDHGIVEYVPGDLTLTARAGTRLSDIARATSAHGQWLPLNPWGGDDGTIGATVSTATPGPHAHAFGLARDTVLGLEFVTGTGETVRSGGRVVKNVAGFDLTRLLVGSWGTLGVITEVTVRLRALPERSQTVALAVQRDSVEDLPLRLRELPFTPLASELVNGELAAQLGVPTDARLLVQLGGNDRSIRAQADLLSRLGALDDTDPDIWPRMRATANGPAVWRWSQLPSLFGQTWNAAQDAALSLGGIRIHGNPARGVVRMIVPASSSVDPQLIAKAMQFQGTIAIETLPRDAWTTLETRPANDALSRAIRIKFDPAGILNPGILGDAA